VHEWQSPDNIFFTSPMHVRSFTLLENFLILLCLMSWQSLIKHISSKEMQTMRKASISLYSWGTHLWKISMRVCLVLHESLWQNLLSKVGYHMEVYLKQERLWSFILLTYHAWTERENKNKTLILPMVSELNSRWFTSSGESIFDRWCLLTYHLICY
jgi:hypothetical protein